MESLRSEKLAVSHAHIRWMNPLPPDLGEILLKYQKILIPEMNLGQLSKLVRAEYLVDAEGLNIVRGRPFRESHITEKIREFL